MALSVVLTQPGVVNGPRLSYFTPPIGVSTGVILFLVHKLLISSHVALGFLSLAFYFLRIYFLFCETCCYLIIHYFLVKK